MNRQDQIIATVLAQAASLRKEYGPAHVIRLSVYATDHDLRQLRPEDGPAATAAEQRTLTEAVAAALRAEGYLVQFTTLQAAPYLAWLSRTGKPNTPAHRAQWISQQTQA